MAMGVITTVLDACTPQARSSLTHVVLKGIDLDRLLPPLLLAACPQLKRLGLQDCRLTPPTTDMHLSLAAVAAAGAHPRLQQLSLSSFRPTFNDQCEDVGYLTAMLQAELANLPNLNDLAVEYSTHALLPSLIPIATQLTRLQCTAKHISYGPYGSSQGALTNRLGAWACSLVHVKHMQIANQGYLQAPDLRALLRLPTPTHLTLDGFYLPTESFTDAPCRWESLCFIIQPGSGIHLPTLAHLPLHSLKQPLQVQLAASHPAGAGTEEAFALLTMENNPSGEWCPQLSLHPTSASGSYERVLPRHLAALKLPAHLQALQRAVSNVDRCGGVRWSERFGCLHWVNDLGLGWSQCADVLAAALPLIKTAAGVRRLAANSDLTVGLAAALAGSTLGVTLDSLVLVGGEVGEGVRVCQVLPQLKHLDVQFRHDKAIGQKLNTERAREFAAACAEGAVRSKVVQVWFSSNRRNAGEAWHKAVTAALKKHDPTGLVQMDAAWETYTKAGAVPKQEAGMEQEQSEKESEKKSGDESGIEEEESESESERESEDEDYMEDMEEEEDYMY